jgi:glycerol uptake facilitator-like aquaporin
MTLPQYPWWRDALFEIAGTALLTAVAILSSVRVQLGQGTLPEALLASVMLGLGFGLILLTFGPYTGAQGNPLVSFVAAVYGGQSVSRTLAMASGQLLGAGLVAGMIHAALPDLASPGRDYMPIHMLAECMASFGMLLVALAVAHRQDATVPLALGTFATASLWMTGRATLGNPVVSITVLILSTGWIPAADVLRVLGAQVLGAAIAVGVASFLFPWARESARVLLFRPRQPRPAL